MAGYLTSRRTKVRNCLDVPIRIEAIKFPDFEVFSEEVLPHRYIEVVYSDLRIEQNPDRAVYIYISVDRDGDGTNYTKIHINPSWVRDHKQIDITTPSATGIITIKGNMLSRLGCVVVVRRFATKVGKSAKNLINVQCKEGSTNVVACIKAAVPESNGRLKGNFILEEVESPKDDQAVPKAREIAGTATRLATERRGESSSQDGYICATKAGRGIGKSEKKPINQCKKEDTSVVDCTRPLGRSDEIEINGGVEPECFEDQGQKINGTLKEDIFFLHSYYAVVACNAVGTHLVLPVKEG